MKTLIISQPNPIGVTLLAQSIRNLESRESEIWWVCENRGSFPEECWPHTMARLLEGCTEWPKTKLWKWSRDVGSSLPEDVWTRDWQYIHLMIPFDIGAWRENLDILQRLSETVRVDHAYWAPFVPPEEAGRRGHLLRSHRENGPWDCVVQGVVQGDADNLSELLYVGAVVNCTTSIRGEFSQADLEYYSHRAWELRLRLISQQESTASMVDALVKRGIEVLSPSNSTRQVIHWYPASVRLGIVCVVAVQQQGESLPPALRANPQIWAEHIAQQALLAYPENDRPEICVVSVDLSSKYFLTVCQDWTLERQSSALNRIDELRPKELTTAAPRVRKQRKPTQSRSQHLRLLAKVLSQLVDAPLPVGRIGTELGCWGFNEEDFQALAEGLAMWKIAPYREGDTSELQLAYDLDATSQASWHAGRLSLPSERKFNRDLSAQTLLASLYVAPELRTCLECFVAKVRSLMLPYHNFYNWAQRNRLKLGQQGLVAELAKLETLTNFKQTGASQFDDILNSRVGDETPRWIIEEVDRQLSQVRLGSLPPERDMERLLTCLRKAWQWQSLVSILEEVMVAEFTQTYDLVCQKDLCWQTVPVLLPEWLKTVLHCWTQNAVRHAQLQDPLRGVRVEWRANADPQLACIVFRDTGFETIDDPQVFLKSGHRFERLLAEIRDWGLSLTVRTSGGTWHLPDLSRVAGPGICHSVVASPDQLRTNPLLRPFLSRFSGDRPDIVVGKGSHVGVDGQPLEGTWHVSSGQLGLLERVRGVEFELTVPILPLHS